MKKILLFVVLIFGILLLPNVLAQSCGDYINESTTLSANISDCAGEGLIINSSNIVLDCDGYSITFNNSLTPGLTDYGIELQNFNNVTISNCKVDGFYYDYLIAYVADINMNNGEGRIDISYTNDSTVSNHVVKNKQWSIYSYEGDNNLFENIYIQNGTEAGVAFDNSDNETLKNSFINITDYSCFSSWTSSGINLTNNKFTGASGTYGYGIELYGIENLNFNNNTVYNNTRDLFIDSYNAVRNHDFYDLNVLNPSGTYDNYTSLDFSISLATSSQVNLNWSSGFSSLNDKSSFNNKFIQINRQAGAFNVTELKIKWQDSELTDLSESDMEIQRENSTNNVLVLSSTLNQTGNYILTEDLIYSDSANEEYAYGLFTYLGISNCTTINSPGEYSIVNPITYNDSTCIKLNSSNIIINLNGNSVAYNGNASIRSSFISDINTITNFTLYNGPSVAGMEYVVDLNQTNGTIDLNSFSSSTSGIFIENNNPSLSDNLNLESVTFDDYSYIEYNNIYMNDSTLDETEINNSENITMENNRFYSSEIRNIAFYNSKNILINDSLFRGYRAIGGTDYVNGYMVYLDNSSDALITNSSYNTNHHNKLGPIYSSNVVFEFNNGFVNSSSSTDSDCFVPRPFETYSNGNYSWCDYDYYYNATNESDKLITFGSDLILYGNRGTFYGNGIGTLIDMPASGAPNTGPDNITSYYVEINNYGLGFNTLARNSYFKGYNLQNNVIGYYVQGSIPFFVRGAENTTFDAFSVINNQRGAFLGALATNMLFNNSLYRDNGFGIESATPYFPSGFEDYGNMSYGGAFFGSSSVENTNFINNTNVGLIISIGSNNTFYNNDFDNNKGIGLALFSEENSRIIGNYFRNNDMTGLMYIGSNVLLEDNQVWNNGDGTTHVDNETFFAFEQLTSSLGVNLTSLLRFSDAFYWSGIVALGEGVNLSTQKDTFNNNLIYDNWDYGIFFYDGADDADLYNNTICNNSVSGKNISQVVSFGPTVNTDTTAPYNNDYCNNTLIFQQARLLRITYTPTDASAEVRTYPENIVQTPFIPDGGSALWVLPEYTVTNTGIELDGPYKWYVEKAGYQSEQDLVSLTANTELVVNLIPGYQPSIMCPVNSTSGICNLMVESGAGLGSFIQNLGIALPTLLIVLIVIGIIAAIGMAISATIIWYMRRY